MPTRSSSSSARRRALRLAHAPMLDQDLGHLARDPQVRIERGHRVLEDHREADAADRGSARLRGRPSSSWPRKRALPAQRPLRREQAHDREEQPGSCPSRTRRPRRRSRPPRSRSSPRSPPRPRPRAWRSGCVSSSTSRTAVMELPLCDRPVSAGAGADHGGPARHVTAPHHFAAAAVTRNGIALVSRRKSGIDRPSGLGILVFPARLLRRGPPAGLLPPERIELGAEDEDDRAAIEEHERDRDPAQAAVIDGIVGQVADVPGEQAGTEQPQHGGRGDPGQDTRERTAWCWAASDAAK